MLYDSIDYTHHYTSVHNVAIYSHFCVKVSPSRDARDPLEEADLPVVLRLQGSIPLNIYPDCPTLSFMSLCTDD